MILLIIVSQSRGFSEWPCRTFFTLIEILEGWRGGYTFDVHHSLEGVSMYKYKGALGAGASANELEVLTPITIFFASADAAHNIFEPVCSRELT